MDQKRRLLINGEKKEYPSGTVYRRIAEEYQKEYPHPIVLVSADEGLGNCIIRRKRGLL